MIKEKVLKLYNLEKLSLKMSAKGFNIYCDFCARTIDERRSLQRDIDILLDDNYTFDETVFKVFWQAGFIKKWNICSTKEKYIDTVRKYVELYGTPMEKDITLYKAISENEELFGGSWTKDIKSAYNFATKYSLAYIMSMVVPKGTKTIHIKPNFRFAESEDIIDTSTLLNSTLVKCAKLELVRVVSPNEIIGIFKNLNFCGRIIHRLNKSDSFYAYGKIGELVKKTA